MNYILPILLFAGLGLLAGVLLTVASKIFAVKTDQRLEEVSELLPQINCGACGFSGCSDYAYAIVHKNAPANLCKPGGAKTAKAVSAVMGVEAKEVEQATAFVRCSGTCDTTPHKFIFDGIQSCAASNRFYNGSKICTSGCLGFGDCAAVCPNGAVSIRDGIAVVDEEMCVGCGMCAKVCPNNLIAIRRKSQRVEVGCSSTAIGKVTRQVCSKGCIGCKMCEKACKFDAVKVENNFARIDYSKCKNCGACVEACKLGVIKRIK